MAMNIDITFEYNTRNSFWGREKIVTNFVVESGPDNFFHA